jgi:hypothetical protein
VSNGIIGLGLSVCHPFFMKFKLVCVLIPRRGLEFLRRMYRVGWVDFHIGISNDSCCFEFDLLPRARRRRRAIVERK